MVTVVVKSRGSPAAPVCPRASTSTSAKPASRRRSSVASGRREVPHHLQTLEVVDELRPGGDLDDRPRVLGDVARLPRTGRPAGRPAERGVQPRRRVDRGRGPSGRSRWRRSRRPARGPRARRGRRPGSRRGRRGASRAFSIICSEASTQSTRPFGSRSSSFAVTRPEPQPASMTNSFPARSRRLKHLEPPLVLRVGDAVVGLGVPLPGPGVHGPPGAHSEVVTGPRSALPAVSNSSIAPERCRVMATSSSPLTSRCLMSSSISNLNTPSAQVTV